MGRRSLGAFRLTLAMATLHLELDIDSDVHPELYVRLASIERSPARQEKLRQLAATGLIWEIVRLHGPAFSEPKLIGFAYAYEQASHCRITPDQNDSLATVSCP